MAIRTDPIILDKETGEPLDYPEHLKARGKPWRVVLISTEGKRVGKEFKSFKKARKWARKAKRDERIDSSTVVSKRKGFGPPSKIEDLDLIRLNQKGVLWCPYCRNFREFEYLPWKNGVCCPICHIPDWDFHVHKNNPKYWSE